MILVLTTPRTASTHLCIRLAEQYGYKNLGEYFLDSLPVQDQLDRLDHLKNNHNYVVKAFPWQLKTTFVRQPKIPVLPQSLFDLSEKTIILVRKDFNAQCRSYYLAKVSKHWSGEPKELEHIALNESYYQAAVSELVIAYNHILSWYQTIDNAEIVYTESIASDARYARPVIWDRDPPIIDFDPIKLFS